MARHCKFSRVVAVSTLALVAAGIFGVSHEARAAVIRFNPDTDFSTAPTTITFGNPISASFTLSYLGYNPDDITYTVDAVSTGGTGAVNSFYNPFASPPAVQPIPYEIGSDIGNNGYTMFTQFPTPAGIAYSLAEDFIGIDFTLPDGLHYGYIEVAGPTLVGYAYETGVGSSIATRPIPEPASLALLGTGLLGLGLIRRRRRSSELSLRD